MSIVRNEVDWECLAEQALNYALTMKINMYFISEIIQNTTKLTGYQEVCHQISRTFLHQECGWYAQMS